MVAKQAVVLIHGIGEQKPMETLRKFVDAVWTRHTAIHNQFSGGQFWSKPDTVSDSYELRKLTTPQNTAGISTDFFEFYWAHLMEGTTYGHVVAWARSLLLRRPSTVPRHLRPVYWLLMAFLIVVAALVIYTIVKFGDVNKLIPTWVSTLAAILLVPALGFAIRSVVGDAARYLHVAPTNVQSRHAIRQAGVSLLKALHTRGYQRIVIVGHSLGSVIGYDILTHAWVDFYEDPFTSDPPAQEALNALEDIANAPRRPPLRDVRAAQRDYFDELFENGNTWRVTDFITLGSPLAHGALLLAKDAADLKQRQSDREYPTCLPQLETIKRGGQDVHRFSFGPDENARKPHHAAVFAATRWTNLYFPRKWIFWGDIVGGRVAPVFGSAIEDVEVSTRLRGGLLSHTLYWTCPDGPTPSHIEKLRDALNLLDSTAVV